MTYKIKSKDFYRLHHIRPRFKTEIESVLFFMAHSVCAIGEKGISDFKREFKNRIKSYPGNLSKTEKTIDNWRTEISSLFSFVIETSSGKSKASPVAERLGQKEDLIDFFRNFLLTFQYPGGHLKEKETQTMLEKKIKFHPAKFILNLMVLGTKKQSGDRFGVSAEEVTHLIFNDLRVTTGKNSEKSVFEAILRHRKNKTSFDVRGDVIRYAKDILDYLLIADLVYRRPNNKFYPKLENLEAINVFLKTNVEFKPYKRLYKISNVKIEDVKALQSSWFLHVSNYAKKDLFETNLKTLFDSPDENSEKTEIYNVIKTVLADSPSSKQIGDLGESISIYHEKNRIETAGGQGVVHLINKIPDHLGVGYDIRSFLGKENKFDDIHIEVKTTLSKASMANGANVFTLTPNEYRAADSKKESYYVYRLHVSLSEIKLFVINDPIKLFKKDKMNFYPTNSGGFDISYKEDAGEWVQVKIGNPKSYSHSSPNMKPGSSSKEISSKKETFLQKILIGNQVTISSLVIILALIILMLIWVSS